MYFTENPVILTYFDDCEIVPNKKEKLLSLIKSLNNDPEYYVLTYKVYLSTYIGVNIKENSDGTF